jgi:hypothetical protein
MANTISNDEKEMYLILHDWESAIAGEEAPTMYIRGHKYWKTVNWGPKWWVDTNTAFDLERHNNGLI